ncbi:hypothetical protein QMK17_24065, partial [Rhodococcus sp. G-MC3]|uniref:hypothetical protein n=1 Tax=Rhodococcus sp. G-MC3 TaxID=3046209 RepID=UPI0024BA61F6
VFRSVCFQQPQGPRTDLWIDFLGHVLILPDSEGSGIKPRVIHIVIGAVSSSLAGALGIGAFPLLLMAVFVGVWSSFLWFGSTRVPLRPMLWGVMTANVVVAGFVVGLAFVVPNLVLVVAVVAVAVEMVGFAVSQACALWRVTA